MRRHSMIVVSLAFATGLMLAACGPAQQDTPATGASSQPAAGAQVQPAGSAPAQPNALAQNASAQPQTPPTNPLTPTGQPSGAPGVQPPPASAGATDGTTTGPSSSPAAGTPGQPPGADQPATATVQAATVTPPTGTTSPLPSSSSPPAAQPPPAPAPSPTPASAPSNDQTLLVFLAGASLILAVISVAAILMASSMFAWRRRLPDGQVSVVPEKVLAISDKLAHANVEQIQWTQDAVSAIKEDVSTFATNLKGDVETFKGDVSDINKAFSVFAATAADKDAQIKRLKEGSDRQVTRQFFRHFIKVLRYAEADAEEERKAGRDASKLEGLRTYLLEALAESGVETFEATPGDDYRKRSDIADNPKVVKTDDAALDWTVKSTVRPGFRMATGADPVIIEKAVVEIYRHGA